MYIDVFKKNEAFMVATAATAAAAAILKNIMINVDTTVTASFSQPFFLAMHTWIAFGRIAIQYCEAEHAGPATPAS